MKYYIQTNKNGEITSYTTNEDHVKICPLYKEYLDYCPISYKGKFYTIEQFQVIQNSQEYKDEIETQNKASFEYEAKSLEEKSSYIEYKGKKISLTEILFKSLVYTSVTDVYVYVKAEDGSLIKMLKATFLLLAAKAKSNLKDVEEALYNASYDKNKSLEDNINSIKNIFDSINKIFND